MDDGDSPALSCDLPLQEQPPVPKHGSRAAAFTQRLPVLGVHDISNRLSGWRGLTQALLRGE